MHDSDPYLIKGKNHFYSIINRLFLCKHIARMTFPYYKKYLQLKLISAIPIKDED